MIDAADDTSASAVALVRGTLDGADCASCPFAVDGRADKPVLGIGPAAPTMVFVGEGPGQTEVKQGVPFVGATGQLLNRALRETGVDRNKAWVTNATACLPTSKDPKVRKQAAQACKPRLERELMDRPDIPVLALGDVAASTLLSHVTTLPITQIAGAHFDTDIDGSGVRSVIPTVHPASMLHAGGADKGPEKTGGHVADLAFWALKWDLLKVKALAAGRDIRLYMRRDQEIFVELTDSNRARELVWDLICRARETGRLTIDLETHVDDPLRNFALQAFVAKIKLLGLAAGGIACSVAWDLLDDVMVEEFAKVLADPRITLGFHNATYDMAVLQNQWHRFTLAGDFEDTLLGQHAAWPGAPKRLQHVVAQYRAVEPWKSEHRDSGDSLEDEAVYCLHRTQGVVFADGSIVSVQRVVSQKLVGPVRTVLPDGKLGVADITAWHRNRVDNQPWVEIHTVLSKHHGLIVTPDHKVFTTRGAVQAADVVVGDNVLIDEAQWDARARGAVLGTLLGDSSLYVSPAYRPTPFRAPRAGLQGGHVTRDGLTHLKCQALPFLQPGKIRPAGSSIFGGVLARRNEFQAYGSTMLRQLRELAPLLYTRKWRRKIDPRVYDLLGPVGWAWWFMDDGCRQNNARGDTVCLALCRYKLADRQRTVAWLRQRFGARINVYKDGVIRFGRAESRAFCTWIAPYVFDKLRYKFPRNENWPAEKPWCFTGLTPHTVAVTRVSRPRFSRRDKHDRYAADTRWCITVPTAGRFFTANGLVSNCAKDVLSTDATIGPTHLWIKRNKVEKVYGADRVKAQLAVEMHLNGYFVDPDVNTEIKRRLKSVIDESNESMNARCKEIEERFHHKLAAEQAKTKRKADSDEYGVRVRVRQEELAAKVAKGKFEFSLSNDWHAAAFLKAAGVPLWQTTDSGRTATGGAILEKFSQFPEVDALIRLRSNEQLYETFALRMFEWTTDSQGKWRPPHVQDDGRCHPIWSPTQISGRFGSKDPASSNWSTGDETNADPRKRLPNLRRQLVAEPGYAIVAFDKEQLEARLIAVQSGDAFLCDIFARGLDIHHEFGVLVFTAMRTLDKASEEYQNQRNLTKRVEYGAIYGGADATIHKAIAAEEPKFAGPRGLDMVRASVAKMKQAIPGVFAWQQRLLRETSLPPYTLRSYLLGRCRVFPLGNPPPTDIANNPNQFAGADIMDIGLMNLMPRLETYPERPKFILHQHDAIFMEVREDLAERLAKDIDEAFYMEVPAVNGQMIAFPNEVKIGYAYNYEASDKQKAANPQLVWPCGRPGLKKYKVPK